MQLANDAVYQTHYNILNVKEDASPEEIRASYKSALLTSHPDKLQHTSQTNADHNETQTRFLEIQTAWEILGDVKSRALYDKDLRLSRQEDVIADEVELENMTVEASGDVVELFYQCRCGDYFSVDSLELGEMGFQLSTENNKISLNAHNSVDMASVVLPCGSCSLKIRLIINSCPHP
uniref:DPH4 homolog n=1 Tax=Erigeron canadensis TaxID=72917 RepID=UPI001CB8A1F1|nr:DPH4 homolog [Erigeron canadensis]